MKNKSNVNKLIGVICAGLLLTHAVSGAHENEQTEEKILKLSVDSIKQLEIEAGAGSIKLIGNDGNEIVVTAKITKSSDTDYELSLEKKHGRAYLIATNDSNRYNSRHHFKIDLEISVPSKLAIDLTDGSGDISIENMHSDVNITDGSGDISIKNMLSDVNITDGSGSIHVQDTKGRVEVKDGSGDIRISNVGGKVEINDGSGSITTINLSDDLDIRDGSGDIDIEQVKGSVVVHDGSGSINVDTVGNFKLALDGSGDIDVTNVAGEVDLGRHKYRQ